MCFIVLNGSYCPTQHCLDGFRNHEPGRDLSWGEGEMMMKGAFPCTGLRVEVHCNLSVLHNFACDLKFLQSCADDASHAFNAYLHRLVYRHLCFIGVCYLHY